MAGQSVYVIKLKEFDSLQEGLNKYMKSFLGSFFILASTKLPMLGNAGTMGEDNALQYRLEPFHK